MTILLACCFLLLAAPTLCSSQSVNTSFLIRPNSKTQCFATTTFTDCLSLEEFAEKGQVEGTNEMSITLELIPGIHNLSTSIVFSNFRTVRIHSSSSASSTMIRCSKPANLNFFTIEFLVISQLSIDACGMGLDHSTLEIAATSEANLNNIQIINSYGSAIGVFSCFVTLKSIEIIRCGFHDFNYSTSGGAVNAYNSELVISGNSVFSENSASCGGAISLNGGNLTVIGKVNFTYNEPALFGGGICVIKGTSVVLDSEILFIGNAAYGAGGAIYIEEVLRVELSGTFLRNSAVLGGAIGVVNATAIAKLELSGTFLHNRAWYGGAIGVSNTTAIARIYLSGTFLCNSAWFGGAIEVVNTTAIAKVELSGNFLHNSAWFGGAIGVVNATAIARDMILSENYARVSCGGIILWKFASLQIPADIFIIQSNTAVLSGGGMCLYDSEVIVNTTAKVINNSAIEGGGCYLGGQSYFHLGTEATLQFSDNTASHRGGAIYVDEDLSKKCPLDGVSNEHCLFTVQKVDRYIELWNNSAANAGSILYGGTIDCIIYGKYNFYEISNIGEDENAMNLSSIASDPYYVCFCENGDIHCEINSTEFTAYPGQKFNVSVVTVGRANGVVPSTVQAHLGPNSQATLGDFQNNQETTTACSNLTFTLFSSNKFEIITLTSGICSVLSTKLKQHLNVTLLECPRGFQLADNRTHCRCHERLLQYTKVCNIDDQTIHRANNFWVYYDNVTQGLVLHPHCPFDYCTLPPNNFALQHSDQLCNYNRTGLLCGQCGHGLSLALGTSRCLNCSNYYLLLLLAFAIAGLALVFLLFVCRLTVAMGTVNGLIFYANIVHSNQTLFFPASKTNIFIAWLSLDLGIETCFYNGMDTYTRTWLQFVFPLYVWFLCGCIVFVSSRSYLVSRILGTNPVAVLATLFLLSYTKLLRTAITTLAFTTLSYPHNHTRLVWLYDANIDYLQGKHIPLFVVGLTTLLLCLPYTMLLLTSQWLRAWSNHCLLRWVNSPRLKFLLDAYNAPYKPKHSYWTGLLLLTRLLLYIVYAVNALGNTNVNLLATSIAAATLAGWMSIFDRPYKSRLLGALETVFLLNILFLGISTLYIRAAGGDQGALAYTSTGLSLAVFFAVVAFHCFQQIRHTHLWKTITTRSTTHLNEGDPSSEVDEDINTQGVSSMLVTHSEIVLPQCIKHCLQSSPHFEIDSTSDNASYDADTNRQTIALEALHRNEETHEPLMLNGSVQVNSSQESLDMMYSEVELREPLLSDDFNH